MTIQKSYKARQAIAFAIFSILELAFMLFSYAIELSDRAISIWFTLAYIVGLLAIWQIDRHRLSLFFVFYLSLGLFIGGRFIAVALGYDGDPFETTFFHSYSVEYSRKLDILSYINLFIYFTILGYYLKSLSPPKNKSIFSDNQINTDFIKKLLRYSFPFVALALLYGLIQSVKAVANEGYLALYIGKQNSSYAGSNIIDILFPLFFGLAYTFGTKSDKRNYGILFVCRAVINILMGTRSAFGAMMLVFLWIYAQKHTISIKKILISISSALCLLLFVYSFSIRAAQSSHNDNDSNIDKVLQFIYMQGVSAMVFDISRDFNYPHIPYVQSFIPGYSSAYRTLSGEDLQNSDVSFGGSLASQLNPKLYYEGMALGWTVLGDIYLLSGRTYLGYIILSILFGMMFHWLEIKSRMYSFYRYASFTLAYSITLLPRGAISSIFPLYIYAIVFWIILANIVPKNKPLSVKTKL